MNVNCTKSC